MDDGKVGASDAATLALLYGGGRGGYGGYGGGGGIGVGYGAGGYGGGGMLYSGNSVLAAEAHANGTASKEAIDGNREFTRLGLDRLADVVTVDSRSREFNRVDDQLSNMARDIANNNLSASERSAIALLEAQKCCCENQKAIADAAKEAALCCCNAQLQAARDHAEIKALVISENAATRELMRGDALAAANAKIIQLETINALSDKHR